MRFFIKLEISGSGYPELRGCGYTEYGLEPQFEELKLSDESFKAKLSNAVLRELFKLDITERKEL